MSHAKNGLSLLASVGFAVLYGASPALAQTAPSMGQAASFAVLGSSTVTNTGLTTIVGNLGVSPGTAVTGFPPGTVTGGTIHANDALAIQAQNDLTAAYDALASQAFNTDLTGQGLGGLTLAPGIYRFLSTAQLTGTLTLDAQGNANAVFIFQIGSTLTTASNSSVLVINGGNNCSVFWQVGSSATLGTVTAFKGNVLALTSITLNAGASVSGRLLARNGAVTLDTNDVAVCPACNPVTLSPLTLANGTVGAAYSQAITASGGTGPYTYSVTTGSLPAGLTFSSGGVLSGTPTTAGSFSFTVRATDSVGCFGDWLYAIVINAAACPTITVSPTILPVPTAGIPYDQTITASGGTAPYAFSVTFGSLPAGLTLVSSGVLSGTPTTAGVSTFTVTATDALSCFGSRSYTVAVVCPTIAISPATLTSGTVGAAYSQAITASGGTGPYTYSVTTGSLPAGLTFSAGGVLSGTPTTAGSFSFTVRATDSVGCFGDWLYAIVINAAACPTITVSPSILPVPTAGIPYNQTITASGGTAPYAFSVTFGSLPAGLTLVSSGVLSGTPITAGVSTFTVTATDALSCFGSRSYTVAVVCPTIAISPATLTSGTVGAAYSQAITASGGTGPYTYSVTTGSLPSGITLSSTGLLSGQGLSAGTFTFTITARDSNNCPASQAYTLGVAIGAYPIPTLSEWGLILLTGLLALLGSLTLMRKSGRTRLG
jgi:large repetitive protein